MGLLDDLKHKAEQLGDKAKEGLDGAFDKAGDLVGDVKERLGQHDDEAGEQAPLGESDDLDTDVGTLNPTDVPEDVESGPDADADAVSADDLDAEEASSEWEGTTGGEDVDGTTGADANADLDADTDADDDADADADADDEVAVGAGDAATTDTDAAPDSDSVTEIDADDQGDEPTVESDVDPFAEPLTEPIGDAIDAAALAEVVEATSDDQDPQG